MAWLGASFSRPAQSSPTACFDPPTVPGRRQHRLEQRGEAEAGQRRNSPACTFGRPSSRRTPSAELVGDPVSSIMYDYVLIAKPLKGCKPLEVAIDNARRLRPAVCGLAWAWTGCVRCLQAEHAVHGLRPGARSIRNPYAPFVSTHPKARTDIPCGRLYRGCGDLDKRGGQGLVKESRLLRIFTAGDTSRDEIDTGVWNERV